MSVIKVADLLHFLALCPLIRGKTIMHGARFGQWNVIISPRREVFILKSRAELDKPKRLTSSQHLQACTLATCILMTNLKCKVPSIKSLSILSS